MDRQPFLGARVQVERGRTQSNNHHFLREKNLLKSKTARIRGSEKAFPKLAELRKRRERKEEEQ